MEHLHPHNPEEQAVKKDPKDIKNKKGFLNRISGPAKRIAQSAALLTSLATGVETVNPEIGLKQTTEDKAEWIRDLKDREDEEKRQEREKGR